MPNSFLALVYKIPNISSFNFISLIKKSLQEQGLVINKIGFSGTLDPFARGQLILGVNSYTRLFSHIKKDYKTYRATVFLGCESVSLDTENIMSIELIKKIDSKQIESLLQNLKGRIHYSPPRFSAKHIHGIRAYKLARENKNFCMQKSIMDIKECRLLAYHHPFVSFEITLSEGGFVRSVAEIIGQSLGIKASLCYLERLSEGDLAYREILNSQYSALPKFQSIIELQFSYHQVQQKAKLILIDIQNALKYDTIKLINYRKQAQDGKRFRLNNICYKNILASTGVNDYNTNIRYLADFGGHYGIIEMTQDREIKYIVNRIDKC
ncbi:tRNA pseudouridine(55) synthase TruB [Helicobacter sp. MIT 14-3879]|nr:tRNA pseudouridine(55) synthase TruB [Helicobacter sp. MIT 14-3879]